jgi:hypothetical protein
MGRIYSYQYLNQYADVEYIPTPALSVDDVLEVSRNGIGMQAGTYVDETVETDVFEYNRRSYNTNTADTNKYIIQISNSPTLSSRVVVYEFGSLVEAGDVYRFEYNALYGVEYIVQPGDTVTDVRNEVKTLIDAAVWPGVTITSSSISTNRLELTYNNFFTQLNPLVTFGVKYLFQNGYYVTLLGKDYLIENHNAYDTYYTLAGHSASYAFAALTYMPSGLDAYINNPSYTFDFGGIVTAGTTDITDVSTPGSLGMGKYLYSETEQKLYFSEYLQPGEYIKMLYK